LKSVGDAQPNSNRYPCRSRYNVTGRFVLLSKRDTLNAFFPCKLSPFIDIYCVRIMAKSTTQTSTDVPLITPGEATPMEEAASRSELAAKYRQHDATTTNYDNEDIDKIPDEASTPPEVAESAPTVTTTTGGTILEAAFVDPAYSWPPADGQGKNAIELQASIKLLQSEDDDNASIFTTESALQRMRPPNAPHPKTIRSLWSCCRATETVVTAYEMRAYEEQKALAAEARQLHLLSKVEHTKQKEKAARKAAKYLTVPEGILIYRLDTNLGQLKLVSQTHALTDVNQIVHECFITSAIPYGNKSRRTFQITDEHGNTHLLTACEQRTGTAWLEAMNLMIAKTHRSGGTSFFRKVRRCNTCTGVIVGHKFILPYHVY
jgi:hypothetical protein